MNNKNKENRETPIELDTFILDDDRKDNYRSVSLEISYNKDFKYGWSRTEIILLDSTPKNIKNKFEEVLEDKEYNLTTVDKNILTENFNKAYQHLLFTYKYKEE